MKFNYFSSQVGTQVTGVDIKEQSNFTLFAAILCDRIWLMRNRVKQENERVDPSKIYAEIKSH